jgi:hypothetical protein
MQRDTATAQGAGLRAKVRCMLWPMPVESIEKLRDYFQQLTACTAEHEWKIDFHCHRFYFQKENHDGWRYVQTYIRTIWKSRMLLKPSPALNGDKWEKVLEENSGKRVPFFKDKKFAAPFIFRRRPT